MQTKFARNNNDESTHTLIGQSNHRCCGTEGRDGGREAVTFGVEGQGSKRVETGKTG